MKKKVAIIGAGGKMGRRAADKLRVVESYSILHCEKEPRSAELLRQDGFTVEDLIPAVSKADFVVLAIPDEVIGQVSHEVIDHMKNGATLIALDAAAAYIGEIPRSTRITQMITHPCHPPLFGHQTTEEARHDHFGGIATQDILVSLIEGSEQSFAEGTELCRAMYAPVGKAHRVTPDQFALLEPAMSEIVVATAATLMKQAFDAAIEYGVPREAAEAFMAGHTQIALAIVFGVEKSPFSDACQVAIRWSMKEIIRPDWKRVFERPVLSEAIKTMLHPEHLADGKKE